MKRHHRRSAHRELPSARTPSRLRRRAFRPSFESLEVRNLLTTFVVDTVLDDPLADASQLDGLVSLREAIAAANQDRPFGDAPAGQSDVVDHIAFSPTLSGMTVELQGAQLTIEDNLSIEGLGQKRLRISGSSTSRVLWINTDAVVEISGVALTNGMAPTGGEDYGGAIVNFGTLTIRDSFLGVNTALEGGAVLNVGAMQVFNSAITGNSALAGGGIENVGDLHITNSVISENAADEGGGIANYGGTVNVTASSLKDNLATESGGAVFNYRGDVTLEESAVSVNTASDNGGGLYTDGGTITINVSELHANSARNGGGIYSRGGSVVIASSVFQDNVASLSGGGVLTTSAGGSSALKIQTSTFADNHAAFGGALRSIFSDAEISNSTFSGNTALRDGGGIHNLGPLLIAHSTITGNRADADGNDVLPEGGGIMDFQSRAMIFNSIIAGNFRGISQQPDDIGNQIDSSSAFNLIGDAATSGGLSHGSNGNLVGNAGSGTLDIATVLETQLANNGGPTMTHALVVGSPAIDAASSSLQYDQRGWWRLVDGDGDGNSASDIGAYERVTLDALWTTLGGQIQGLSTQDALSQGEAMRLSNFLHHVATGTPSKADHFLHLFNSHLGRLVDTGRLSHATANLIEDAVTSILQRLQQGGDEQQALDELFAEFEFGWGILN